MKIIVRLAAVCIGFAIGHFAFGVSLEAVIAMSCGAVAMALSMVAA